jgi:hypothetical protein
MKVTVEFSEKEMRDILRFSSQKKKGPAIRELVVTELMLRRRREISEKVLRGEISAELPSIEELRKDRKIWD